METKLFLGLCLAALTTRITDTKVASFQDGKLTALAPGACQP